jgi:hypothetical protein
MIVLSNDVNNAFFQLLTRTGTARDVECWEECVSNIEGHFVATIHTVALWDSHWIVWNLCTDVW